MRINFIILCSFAILNVIACSALPLETFSKELNEIKEPKIEVVGDVHNSQKTAQSEKGSEVAKVDSIVGQKIQEDPNEYEDPENFKVGSSGIKIRPRPPIFIGGGSHGGSRGSSNNLIALSFVNLLIFVAVIYTLA